MHRLMKNYKIRKPEEITNNASYRDIKDGNYEKENKMHRFNSH